MVNHGLDVLESICVHDPNYRHSYGFVNRNSCLAGYRFTYKILIMESTLQHRLKFARKRAKKSQAAVAEAVGISQPTYSDLERGESQGTTLLPQIAFFLGVNAYWLATGRGPAEDGIVLSDEERELVAAWRSFPEGSKQLVLTQFRALRPADA